MDQLISLDQLKNSRETIEENCTRKEAVVMHTLIKYRIYETHQND